jgi:hypothetical protein
MPPLDGRLGTYTRLRFLLVFAVGAVLSTGFYVIGLNYWLLVGAFVGFVEIVPAIGLIVGSILVLAVGIPQSLHIAALSLLWLVLVREFQTYVVNPHIGQTVGLSPLVTLLSVAVVGILFGGLAVTSRCRSPRRLRRFDASRARPRPARRATSPPAPAPSLAMSTAARATARATVRNSARAPL